MPRQRNFSVLISAAKANGFKIGEHKEADKQYNLPKHNDETKRSHGYVLHRYLAFQCWKASEEGSPIDEETANSRFLSPGTEIPSLEIVKDFLRFFAASSEGLLEDKISRDTLLANAERFFAGFEVSTQSVFGKSFRSMIYEWVPILVKQEVVGNKHRPKHNFSPDTLDRVLNTLLNQDIGTSLYGRLWIQIFWIIPSLCSTGARIGSYFKGGIQYKDLEIVLKKKGNSWRPMYKFDQRWVKNNNDPKNTSYGTTCLDHERLRYDSTVPLLAIALADGVFADIDSIEDLKRITFPETREYFPLIYKKGAEERFFLRGVSTSGAVQENALREGVFRRILGDLTKTIGYRTSVCVHSIRRYLGKKLDEQYTETQRSQHVGHKDPSIYGQSYLANTSSVDGLNAFLGQPLDHEAVDYFQSLEKFYVHGLPLALPNARRRAINSDPELQRSYSDLSELGKRDSSDSQCLAKEKSALKRHRESLMKSELESWRDQYAEISRLACIPGKAIPPLQTPRDEVFQILSRAVPDRGRIKDLLMVARPVESGEWWRALHHMHAICLEVPVIYLPHHQPKNGRCPAESCEKEIETINRTDRNAHIHECMKRELSDKAMQLPSHVRYCYFCLEWVCGNAKWRQHCRKHLEPPLLVRCGSLTYHHTLVRPAYCPFCIGDNRLPADKRLQSWSRDRSLWGHILEKHLNSSVIFPQPCPHPRCQRDSRCLLPNAVSAADHLVDFHSLAPDDNIFSQLETPRDGPKADPPRLKSTTAPYTVLMPFGTQLMLPPGPETEAEPPETICPKVLTLSNHEIQPGVDYEEFEDQIINWGDGDQPADQLDAERSINNVEPRRQSSGDTSSQDETQQAVESTPSIEGRKKVAIRLTYRAGETVICHKVRTKAGKTSKISTRPPKRGEGCKRSAKVPKHTEQERPANTREAASRRKCIAKELEPAKGRKRPRVAEDANNMRIKLRFSNKRRRVN